MISSRQGHLISKWQKQELKPAFQHCATWEAVLLEKNLNGEAAVADGMWLRWTGGEVA